MTLEQCEELLRRDPAACSRFYRKIRSEVKTMEVRESEHRWMIRRALADGPKTAMQASNWARQQGDHHMDRPLAQSILMNLVKGGEIALKQMSGTPDLFSATPLMRTEPLASPAPAVARPMENPLASPAAPPPTIRQEELQKFREAALSADPPPPTFTIADLNRPMGNGALATAEPSRLKASEIVALCAGDQIGKRRMVNVDAGSIRAMAQNFRMALNTRVSTRAWRWSVHVVKANVLAVMKVGIRDEPDVERPAPIDTPVPRVELASSEEIQMAASRNEIAPPAPAIIQERPVAPPAGKPWAAGRAALAEVDKRITTLIEMRGALLRVIPVMETGGV